MQYNHPIRRQENIKDSEKMKMKTFPNERASPFIMITTKCIGVAYFIAYTPRNLCNQDNISLVPQK